MEKFSFSDQLLATFLGELFSKVKKKHIMAEFYEQQRENLLLDVHPRDIKFFARQIVDMELASTYTEALILLKELQEHVSDHGKFGQRNRGETVAPVS